MWNDQSAQGGGFFNSPNQFGAVNTPNSKVQKTGRRTTRTAPIVIRQALHSSDDGVKIWGSDVQIVSIIARIRNVKIQSTKINYTIQDITGRMKAIVWIDQDSMADGEDKAPQIHMVNTYVQLFGSVKTNHGKKVLMVFKILNITDVNAITFHYLQCIHNKIQMEADAGKAEKNKETESAQMPANSMIGMASGGGTGTISGLNPRQAMVFQLIRASTQETGTNKMDMYNTLKDRMNKVELENILDWMCGEGHIYSTIDEEHFRATDSL